MLAQKFQNIDDLYISERIYAAAYGAACLESNDICSGYARIAYKSLFADSNPPLNLRLRDYAKQIIYLANSRKDISNEIDFALVHPPYKSDPPVFGISEKELEQLAEEVDGKQIFYSCHWDDFGIYEIDPATRNICMVKLSDPAPFSLEERYEEFKDSFPVGSSKRSDLEALENAIRDARSFSFMRALKRQGLLNKSRQPKQDENNETEISTEEILNQKDRC
jgi:hypothetical protein